MPKGSLFLLLHAIFLRDTEAASVAEWGEEVIRNHGWHKYSLYLIGLLEPKNHNLHQITG